MTNPDHVCDESCITLNNDFYSDDNCICRGEVINKACPRHGVKQVSLDWSAVIAGMLRLKRF